MKSYRTFEYFLVRLLIIAAFLLSSFLGVKIAAAFYYERLSDNLSGPLRTLKAQYQQQIATETDPYELCRLGVSFSVAENDDLALAAFTKAAQMDPTYRDAWVWKGYTELKKDNPSQALVSLKKAEKIDPIYPLTYQLLVIAYQQNADPASAQKAQEKLDYLTRSTAP